MAVLFAVFTVLHWLTRSRRLIDWDAVNYALALERYDVIHDQPHMPGYYLYIQLARLVLPLTGEANAALVLLSAVFGTLCGVMLYLLGRDLFGTRVGRIAALLGMSGPLFWYQSGAASSRITEAFFSLWIAWLAIRLRWYKNENALWGIAISLAIVTGIRQQAAPFLIPLCLWGTWRTPISRRIAAGALFGLLSLAWAVPMLKAVGGMPAYRALNKAQWELFIVHGTGVFYAHDLKDAVHRWAENNVRIVLYAACNAPLGALFFPWAIRLALRRQFGGMVGLVRADERVQLFLAATGPALVFYSWFHIQQTGHAMAYAPFMTLAVAAGCLLLPARRQALAATLLMLGNAAFFLLAPPRLVGDWYGTPSWASVRAHDAELISLQTLMARETKGRASQTLILAVDDIARPLDYYLPGYTAWAVVVDPAGAGAVWKARRYRGDIIPFAQPNVADAPVTARDFVLTGENAAISWDPQTRQLSVRNRHASEGWRLSVPADAIVRHAIQGPASLYLVEVNYPVRLRLLEGGGTLVLEEARPENVAR